MMGHTHGFEARSELHWNLALPDAIRNLGKLLSYSLKFGEIRLDDIHPNWNLDSQWK
jgi:hypothetical protein